MKHQAAEALSRLRTAHTDRTPLYNYIPVLTVERNHDHREDLSRFVNRTTDILLPCPQTSYILITINAASLLKKPISTDDFIIAQCGDIMCENFAKYIGLPSSRFSYDHMGVLVRTSMLNGSLKRLVPTKLRANGLYLSH